MTFNESEVSNYVVLSGELSSTAIGERQAGTVKSFILKQNYPNPFNPSTIIGFELLETGKVELAVFNVLGQKVDVLLNEVMTSGAYQFEFNAKDLSSGIYYYELKAGGQTFIKKMTYVK